MRYGGDEARMIETDWVAGPRAPYPMLHTLQVGQHWTEARLGPDQTEGQPIVDGVPIPAGLAIAELMMAEGADWSFCSEVWSRPTFLAPDGLRADESVEPLKSLLELLVDPVTGGLGGMPDAIGMRSDTLLLFESKRPGDSVRANQHAFADRARSSFSGPVEVALVAWGT